MKNKLIISALMLLAFCAKSQFKGGSGDGYSSQMVSVVFQGIENQSFVSELIYPTLLKSNESITVLIDDVKSIVLTDVLGIQTTLKQSDSNKYLLNSELQSGSYQVMIITGASYLHQRIVIYD